MWEKVKKVYNEIWLFGLALFLIGFLFFTIFTLLFRSAGDNLDSITAISVLAVIFSFPGMVNTLADEFNPKKKTYKLSCQCPKCRHLIRMDMKEE